MLDYQGKKFEKYVETNRLNKTVLAKKLGVSRNVLYNYFLADSLQRETVLNIITTIGVSENEIWGDGKIEETDLQEKSPTKIPMYNFPVSAGNIEMYNDPNSVRIVGHLNLPGAKKGSFALPVYGHSMYPTLENGSWGILRPIKDVTEIVWGEIYYIEWSDYAMYKRLIKSDSEDKVTLWSDNQSELVGTRVKYASQDIQRASIRRLCLLTDIYKKPNY